MYPCSAISTELINASPICIVQHYRSSVCSGPQRQTLSTHWAAQYLTCVHNLHIKSLYILMKEAVAPLLDFDATDSLDVFRNIIR